MKTHQHLMRASVAALLLLCALGGVTAQQFATCDTSVAWADSW